MLGDRILRALTQAAHGLFYAVAAGLLLMCVTMGVITFQDRDRPEHWGTFTATSRQCDRTARGEHCEVQGRWRSDDGAISLASVMLDGDAEVGETVRTSYKPGGEMGDDVNNIVHEPFFIPGIDLWLPWALAAVVGGFLWKQHRRWQWDARREYPTGRHHVGAAARRYHPGVQGEKPTPAHLEDV